MSLLQKVDLLGFQVLIAEDDFIAAMDVADTIEACGGNVSGPVAAADDGVALLRRSRPHMALLDMQLEDGFVTPLATILRQLEVPFGLVTAYRGKELDKPPLQGAPRLSKPYLASDLVRLIRILREDVVRRRAHVIWEREGHPNGRAEQHWLAAERELGGRSGRSPTAGGLPGHTLYQAAL
jgi:CheY-like chemotaxis protein